jgi:hypothetical protein
MGSEERDWLWVQSGEAGDDIDTPPDMVVVDSFKDIPPGATVAAVRKTDRRSDLPPDVRFLLLDDDFNYAPDTPDEGCALALLNGFIHLSSNSKKTSHRYPTGQEEQSCRKALARVLLRGDPPQWLLDLLADLFAPGPSAKSHNARTVIFKKVGKSRTNARTDFLIGLLVDSHRSDGVSYEDATARVAENQGLEPRRVREIYGRYKKSGMRLCRTDMASDARTNDMASDK